MDVFEYVANAEFRGVAVVSIVRVFGIEWLICILVKEPHG